MRVRIGIVSWNTADLLDRCLAALPAAAEGLDFDVVVVDNHSADESANARAATPASPSSSTWTTSATPEP